MILKKLISLFTPPLTIHVNPELFYFTTGTESLQLGTYLILKKAKGKYAVHSVGKDVSPAPDIFRVDLFRNTDLPESGGRMEILAAYLRYAIVKTYRSKRLVSPVVNVKNAHSLDDVLMGYQYYLLRSVLLETGAIEVRFE